MKAHHQKDRGARKSLLRNYTAPKGSESTFAFMSLTLKGPFYGGETQKGKGGEAEKESLNPNAQTKQKEAGLNSLIRK